MVFANATKHNFSGGELSPKLRGRADLEAYFAGVERMENFVPDLLGPARFRLGSEYLYAIDTTGTPDSTVRDLTLDQDIKFSVLNSDAHGSAESVLISLFRKDVANHRTWIEVRDSAGVTLLEPKYTSWSTYPFDTLKEVSTAPILDSLVMAHPSYFGLNRIYWTGSAWATRAMHSAVYNANVEYIIAYPFFGDAREPRPVGVGFFEDRLVLLSSKPGVVHFSRVGKFYDISTYPFSSGIPRYVKDFLGQTIILSVYDSYDHGSTGGYQVGGTSWREWQIDATTDFKVYLESITTGERTLKTETTDYVVTVTVGLPDPLDEVLEVTFVVPPTTDYRVVLVRNVAYATDAFTVTIQTIEALDQLLWTAPIKDFLAVGSTNGVYSIASSDGTGLSATNIKVTPISYMGSSDIKPAVYKDGFIYVDSTRRNFQYLRYDFMNGGYKAVSLGEGQQNMLTSDITSMAFSPNDPDTIYVVTSYYDLYGYTINQAGQSVGFYRLPTNAFHGVSSVFSYYDILTQKNLTLAAYQTVASLFLGNLDSSTHILEPADYYTGVAATDLTAYETYLYGKLKASAYLDLYTTELNTDSITLPAIFEGWDVDIITDGVYYGTEMVPVSPYTITLDQTYETVHAGFKYRGFIKSVALTGSGTNGEAGAKLKNIAEIGLLFLQTLGAKFGLDLYDLQDIEFNESSDMTAEQPPPLFSGVMLLGVKDNWRRDKHLYIVQDTPFPCTIQRIDLFGETTD